MALKATDVRARNLQSMGLYLGVAFSMAWALWLLAWLTTRHTLSLPLVPVLVIGSFGPFVGALVTTLADGGPRRAIQFFARAFNWRMGWAVFLLSFCLMPFLALVVELVHARLTLAPPRFNMTFAEMPLTYLFLFVLGGTLAEECGWSLLSDMLDGILPLRAATLVLGVIWAAWHLPLFVIIAPGLIQGYTPFHVFLISTVAARFLFAWVPWGLQHPVEHAVPHVLELRPQPRDACAVASGYVHRTALDVCGTQHYFCDFRLGCRTARFDSPSANIIVGAPKFGSGIRSVELIELHPIGWDRTNG